MNTKVEQVAMTLEGVGDTGRVLDVLLVLQFDSEAGDGSERLVRQLRAELSELNVESVPPAPGSVVPEGE